MTVNYSNYLENEEWKFCVNRLPIIAIDLIIKNKHSEILMGRRLNNPAKNSFFVPGGRIFKNEKIEDAIERISNNEISKTYKIKDASFINYFEHFYPNSLWEEKDISTHYIVLAFSIKTNKEAFNLKNQHSEFKWISYKNQELYNIHEYSTKYFNF